MSMIGKFREIPSSLLGRLSSDPSLVQDIVGREVPAIPPPSADPNIAKEFAKVATDTLLARGEEILKLLPAAQRKIVEALPAEKRDEFFKKVADQMGAMLPAHLAKQRPMPRKVDGRVQQALGELLDIEKAWHGLHFLLAGDANKTTPGAGEAVLGGVEVGPAMGYGPARLMSPEKVASISSALSALDEATLRSRIDFATLDAERIYPGGWGEGDRPRAEENVRWLLDAFQDVRRFYASATSRGSAVLLYLT